MSNWWAPKIGLASWILRFSDVEWVFAQRPCYDRMQRQAARSSRGLCKVAIAANRAGTALKQFDEELTKAMNIINQAHPL